MFVDHGDDWLNESVEGYVQGDKNAAVAARCRCLYGTLDVRKPMNMDDRRLNPQWPGSRFKGASN